MSTITRPGRRGSGDGDARTPTASHGTEALPRTGGYGAKRLLLGPGAAHGELEHERLGKITALAIFSSDALSSVAYATQEMLITLFLAGSHHGGVHTRGRRSRW